MSKRVEPAMISSGRDETIRDKLFAYCLELRLLDNKIFSLQILMAIVGAALADVSHILTDTTTYPPRPYQFSYEAGRAPGHTDRETHLLFVLFNSFQYFFSGSHSEVGDGAGTGKY